MTKDIVINPVTRIEGHAKVTIHLDEDGKVVEARFHVTDFRGFEKFSEGRPFYEMPGITSRVCGICPVSHLLASVKACDELLAVSIPNTAAKLRRLMHMGQIIQSHALSFFHLSAPDLLLGLDYDPKKRNILGLIAEHPELARQGIRLRSFGQRIIEHLAGKRIHSSDWIVPGGVKSALSKEKAQMLLAEIPESIKITTNAISTFRSKLAELSEEVENFGNFPTYFLAMVSPDGSLEHYDGNIRIVDHKGNVIADQLDPRKYFEYIGEAVEPWSYMKFPYYKPLDYPDGIYRVGPLARLNVAERCGTPLADDELNNFRRYGGRAVQNTFFYHYARLVEILYCLERTRELLEDEETLGGNVQARASLNRLEGVGAIEAPRGALFHHYKVDDGGRITWANLIVATVQNNLAFQRAVTQVAKRYVESSRLSEGMLNRIEAVVRAFDPCLSCATHALGEMPMRIQLFNSDGDLIDEIARSPG